MIYQILLGWLVFISVVSIIMTVADKICAKRGVRRISENALLCASALGGSVAMLVTMHIIRHKTKHVKFMAGIPLIIVIQTAFVLFVVHSVR